MTCGRGTARDLARAAVRARLARPRVAVLLLAVGLVGGVPLALAGYAAGGVIEGLASVAFMAVVLVIATHRRALASATTLYPAGATLAVELGERALHVRNAAGEQQTPYSAFTTPRRVAGQVLLPLRLVRAQITLPGELLSAADVAWLTERIAEAPSVEESTPQPVAERAAPEATPVEQAWPHEVVLTDDVTQRLTRALVRYRLLGRPAIPRAMIALALLLWVWEVTSRWLVAAAVALLVVVALALLTLVTSTRTLRRQSMPQRTLRARFDDTHLHLDGGGAHSSLAFTALRRCTVQGGAVLLVTRTGLLQVLPREVVPDDAVARIRTAIGAGSR